MRGTHWGKGTIGLQAAVPKRPHTRPFLRHRSAVARLLRSWIRIPPGAWMFVCFECCVLSGRGLCDELITRPEESYRLWCVVVCDQETSRLRRPWPALGRSATGEGKKSGKDCCTLEDETDRLTLHVSTELPLCAASSSKRAQISFFNLTRKMSRNTRLRR